MAWPGNDDPVYFQAQPRRPNRPRHPSEAFVPRLGPNGQTIMVDGEGRLLMPVDAFGRPARSSSVSGTRPTQIFIDNHNTNIDDDRSSSAHGPYYDTTMQRRPSNRSRRSSMVRPRRTPSPLYDDEYYDSDEERRRARYRSREDEKKIRELEEKERELEKLMEEKKEKERNKALQEKLLLEALEKEKKRKAREEEDKKLKAQAVEEWREKEKKEKEKKQKEKEEQEAAFIDLLKTEGYTEAEAKKRLKRMEKRKEKGVTADDEKEETDNRLMKPKPTYIKVHRKHISPDTLDVFRLPWEYDDRDAGYIIIKQWIGERDQETLFNHTKNMANQARIAYPRESLKNDADRLVISAPKPRKKSPIKRTSWFLT